MAAIGTDALLELLDHTFATKTSLVLVLALNLLMPLLFLGGALSRWLSLRRRIHAIFVVVFALSLLAAGVLHLPFFLRLVSGEAGEARVVELETGHWPDSKNSKAACIITVERPDGFRMTAELNRAIEKGSFEKNACENIVAVGDRVPVVFVRGTSGFDQFGREPGARQDVVVLLSVLALAGFLSQRLLPRMLLSSSRGDSVERR